MILLFFLFRSHMHTIEYDHERQTNLSTTKSSELYKACLMNDIPRVEYYLASMNPEEINGRIGESKNTALHAACYDDNLGLVRLLVRHGADGSIKNKHGLYPYQQTTCRAIKDLLSDTGTSAWIVWAFEEPPTRETKQIFDRSLENTFHTTGLPFILDFLLHHYIRQHVAKNLPDGAQKIEE
jgi:hypothetical protein